MEVVDSVSEYMSRRRAYPVNMSLYSVAIIARWLARRPRRKRSSVVIHIPTRTEQTIVWRSTNVANSVHAYLNLNFAGTALLSETSLFVILKRFLQ